MAEEIINTENEKKKDLSLKDTDDLFLQKLKYRKDESDKVLKSKTSDWERNLKFFNGEHWEVARVSMPTYKSDVVFNKFFAAVRSLVAFETDAKPDPEVEARIEPNDPEAETLLEGARKTESMLDYRWDIANVPNILTEIYYDRYIYDDGFGMYFWNDEIDDVDFQQIKPCDIAFAPGSTSVEDAEYVIVRKWRNKKWFQKYYPDLVDKIKFEGMKFTELPTGVVEKAEYENMAKVYHYFEDDVWAIFTEEDLLDKMPNPYWKTEEAQTEQNPLVEVKPIKNHLIKPEKPILHFKGLHLGGELYSRSLVRQVMKLNFAINKRKSQIHENADAVGNPQRAVDPSVPIDKVNMITSEPGLKIRINPSLIANLSPQSLPEQVYYDLEHTEKAFDDVMGHHDISRGASSSKRQTAREATLLRETDVTPVRLVMRNSEMAITKLLNGWVQLMKLFYNNSHFIGQSGNPMREGIGSVLSRENIPDNLSIIIKVGSTMPTSKELKRQEYQNDFQRGVIDPLTYLELMSYPNPKKILQRILNWSKGQIGDMPNEQTQEGQSMQGQPTQGQPIQTTSGI